LQHAGFQIALGSLLPRSVASIRAPLLSMADSYSRPDLGSPGSTIGVQVMGTSQGTAWWGKTIHYVVERRYLNEYRKEDGAEPEDRTERTGRTREATDGDVCWQECEEVTNTYRRNYQFTLVKYEQWLINTTLQAYYDGVNSWTTGTVSAGGSLAGAGASGVAATKAGSEAVAQWLLGDAATAGGVEVLGAGVASVAGTASTALTVLGVGFAAFYITTNVMDSALPSGTKIDEGWEIIGRQLTGESLWRSGQNPRWVACGPKHPCDKPKVSTGGGSSKPGGTEKPPQPVPPDGGEPEGDGAPADGDGDIKYPPTVPAGVVDPAGGVVPPAAAKGNWPAAAAGGAVASLVVGFGLGYLLSGHEPATVAATQPVAPVAVTTVPTPTPAATTIPPNPTYSGPVQVHIDLPCNPNLNTPGMLQMGGGKFSLTTQFTSPFAGTVGSNLAVKASGDSGTITGTLASGQTQNFQLVTTDPGFGCTGGPFPFTVALTSPLNTAPSTSTSPSSGSAGLVGSHISNIVSLETEPVEGGGISDGILLFGILVALLGSVDLALHTKKKMMGYDDDDDDGGGYYLRPPLIDDVPAPRTTPFQYVGCWVAGIGIGLLVVGGIVVGVLLITGGSHNAASSTGSPSAAAATEQVASSLGFPDGTSPCVTPTAPLEYTLDLPGASGTHMVAVEFSGQGLPKSATFDVPPSGLVKTFPVGGCPATWNAHVWTIDGHPLSSYQTGTNASASVLKTQG
jgi:hypothetical protein